MFKFLMTASVRLAKLRIRSGRERSVHGRYRAFNRALPLGVQRLEDRVNPVVTTNQDFDFVDNSSGSLRDEIELINDNPLATAGEITFSSTFFAAGAPAILLLGELPELIKNTTITGQFDNSFVKIDGGGSVFRTSAGKTVSITNMTIQNSSGFQFVDSAVTVTNVKFENTGTDTSGGAIRTSGGHLKVENCSFDGATAVLDGGAIYVSNSGTLTFSGETTFVNCQAGGNGGGFAIPAGSTATSNKATLIMLGCTAVGDGGGFFLAGSTMDLQTLQASNCTASGNGGAASIANSKLTIRHVSITGCSAANGGGINVDTSLLDLSDIEEGLVLYCEAAGSGGAIRGVGLSKIVLDNVSIKSSTAGTHGGAIYAELGTVTVSDGVLVKNIATAGSGGAISAFDSSPNQTDTVQLTNVRIENNSAFQFGGGISMPIGILLGTKVDVIGCKTTNPSAATGGGGVSVDFSTAVRFYQSRIQNCSTAGSGGGLRVETGATELMDVTISGCSAGADGGGLGVDLDFGSQTALNETLLTRTTLSGNTATGSGGGIAAGFFSGRIFLRDNSKINSNNAGQHGGGIHAQQSGGNELSLELRNSEISNCSATFDGGGAWIEIRNVAIHQSTIATNTSGRDGGGLFYRGGDNGPIEMTIMETTFDSNKAFGNGGGLDLGNGKFTIAASTISANKASLNGGGIAFVRGNNGFDLKLENSTLTQNTASQNGGGINIQDGLATILFCTIVSNSATGNGGGIACDPNISDLAADINASVVSGNISMGSGPDVFSTTNLQVLANYSAILNYNGIPGTFENMLEHEEPSQLYLDEFDNYGGYTSTYHPHVVVNPFMYVSPNVSPLIDFIPSSEYPDVLSDQRGVPRPFNNLYNTSFLDIGAVEAFGKSQVVVTNYSVNGGNQQRSRVTSVTVNFTTAVDVALFNPAGAIQFERSDDTNDGINNAYLVQNGTAGNVIISPASGKSSSITLTFNNTANQGVESGSLSDGLWKLSIRLANFRTSYGDIHRLFGDSDGDRDVDSLDASALPALGSPTVTFDWNGNGVFDSVDQGEFDVRLGSNI